MTSFTALIRNSYFLALTAFIGSLNPTLAVDDTYSIAHYTDEHGLPQNSVKGISCDNLGFIWLITEKGPVRYDGNGRFTTFDSLANVLRAARMYSLTSLGTKNALWAQTNLHEMLLLQDGRATLSEKSYWEVFPKPNTYRAEDIKFVVRLPEISSYIYPNVLCLPNSAESCYIVKRDTVSYFSELNKAPAITHHFPHANPWLFAVHHGKLLYIDRINGYTEFHDRAPAESKEITGDLALMPPNTPFKLYWNTAANQLFIYASNSLYLIDKNDQGHLSSTEILSDFSFEENQIIVAYYMPEQRQVLLGSGTKGLLVVKKKLFNTLTAPQRFGNNTYYLQTLLSNGFLLTDEGKGFDPSGNFQLKKNLFHDNGQYNHLVGSNGNLWVLKEDSILIYNADVTRLLRKLPNPTTAKVILKSDPANYWLGGDKGIVLHYDVINDRFTPVAQLPQAVSYFETGNADTLYVGTQRGLFAVHMPTHTWKEIPEFNDKFVRSIYRENNHRLWVCTYQHGFFLYEQGKITHFPLDRSGYLSTAHCILEDRKGFFWISTNKGLFQVDKMQLLQYSKDKRHNPFYFYYNKTDGFTTNEFNGGCQPCGIQLPDGRFSFPSLDGLVWFDPLTVSHEFPSGEIILDQVLLDENPLPIRDTIHISHDFSRLDIKIATPFYGNPYNVIIEYVLDSKGKQPSNWLSIIGTEKTLSINELASGNHQIKVRMRKGIGPQDFQYATFHLYIPPLFHETTWFALLVCFIACLTIWLVIYARTRFILNQNRWLLRKVDERTETLKRQYEWQQRLSTSITHDIKAPLNYVVRALSAIHGIAKAEGFLPREMEQVYLSTKNIYHYSNNLTKLAKLMLTRDNLEFTDVSLYQTTQRQIEIFESVVESRGNTVHNNIPMSITVHSNADILAIIIHNLLDNATKFTQNGKIKINVEPDTDTTILFSITDTGLGFHPEQIDYYNEMNQGHLAVRVEEKSIGFGLLLVKDMAHLIGSEMFIQSILGGGTTISFILRTHA